MSYNSFKPLRPSGPQRVPDGGLAPRPAPPVPAPAPRSRAKWSIGIVAGGCAVIFVALCVVVATDLATRHQATSAVPGASQTAMLGALPPRSGGPVSPGPVVAPVHPKTLLFAEGTGAGRTATFTTGTDWYLRYSYDCPETVQEGHSTLEIFAYSAADHGTPLANDSELSGTDTLPQHGPPGLRYLRVTSPCSWTIAIIG